MVGGDFRKALDRKDDLNMHGYRSAGTWDGYLMTYLDAYTLKSERNRWAADAMMIEDAYTPLESGGSLSTALGTDWPWEMMHCSR
jgi:hypothetical protein